MAYLGSNWGSESDASVAYHSGNAEPKGFGGPLPSYPRLWVTGDDGTGHIGIAVPDVYAACARFDELGVEYAKKPDDG